ncbi:type VI secretion system Vgr family protein [Hydrogenophaga sp.]|uniref:type VI secretion system Vgr family protein n=1 Tax=Hydrogenophaga sp. TaxID=1904254 RepID=UPI00286E80B6|nr:type VI secretion system Vgr family protein [Hydrogenophaga sp.]
MSLYQSILAYLSALPTQNARLLRLHTPLGPDALVAERVEVDEAIGPQAHAPEGTAAPAAAATQLVVHALAGDAHLELKSLIGQPVLLELLTADGSLRPFSGHVTSFALLGSDGGLARYRLVIQPWLAFLGHNQDSWVFQDQTVMEIVDQIFNDHAGQGTLKPQWRWELSDPAVYPRRSLSIQYNESDLAYVHRLLREEGLFYWWEHDGAEGKGSHTLVIADHNGAFQPNAQSRVRFTQAGAVLKEDSLTQVQTHARVRTASLELASGDHRTLSLRPQQQSGQNLPASLAHLSVADLPGAYAYEDNAQGERLLQRQIEALDAQRHQGQATGTVRTAAPATHFTLVDHPVHDGSNAERDQLVILRAQHRARNNLSADHKAQVLSLLGQLAQDKLGVKTAPTPEEKDTSPLYQCELQTQALAQPVRLVNVQANGLPDVRLHPRPTITGVQTALVVGTAEPVHTDRDQRIKVQFHWQRGAAGSHRLEHPTGDDNAPTSDASGTWVRVATPVAGQNWGSVFTPRLGQEVLVAFIAGDIDRPVVIGSVYNGQGQPDAQGNQVARGGSGSTGNAPAWFAGSSRKDWNQGHAHNAVLSGLKSQELPSSQQGSGGHNQLVFDDSPGANRIELSTTQAATRLQLGHLLNQNDNQRLGSRGHGLELATRAWGAVRAGSGLLISSHGKPASTAGAGNQMDSREPLARIQSGQELLHTLAQSAQDHKAQLGGEAQVKGATEQDKAKQLPVEQGLWATQQSLKERQSNGGGESDDPSSDEPSIGGGQGSVTAWSRPDLVLASPAGIIQASPKSGITSAGHTVSLVAGQDINQLAAQNWALAAKDGIVLYTYGKASNGSKPNQETGVQLHAASGNVNSQSQSGATHVVADKAVSVSSTAAGIKVSSPTRIVLTAGGAGITISGGNITLAAPGNITLKAGMKNFTGGASKKASVKLKKAVPGWSNSPICWECMLKGMQGA